MVGREVGKDEGCSIVGVGKDEGCAMGSVARLLSVNIGEFNIEMVAGPL